MATIKEEIMSIAEAQGYEGEGGSTIAEAVNALGSVMGGGGSGGGGDGGAQLMIVHFTSQNGSLVADKSFAEIQQAYTAGSVVFATRGFSGSDFSFQRSYRLNYYESSTEPGSVPYLLFTDVAYSSNDPGTLRSITYPMSGAITEQTKSLTFSS